MSGPVQQRHHALDAFYRTWGTRLIHLLYRPEFIGFDTLPESGPGILVCNHVSYLDGPIIAAGSRRPVRFIIDEAIYHLPIVHHFMRVNRAIPIEPTRKSVSRALELISEGLRDGDLICLFPEGQLTYTGGLSRFKPGIEYIIKRDLVPVYPIALTGLWGSVFSRKYRGSWKRFIPRNPRLPLRAICGDPLDPRTVHVNQLQEAILRLKYTD